MEIVRKGLVSYTIGLYLKLKKQEKKTEAREENLKKWLDKLTDKEFQEYALKTTTQEANLINLWAIKV